jgi:two-component system sensor kinase FixL
MAMTQEASEPAAIGFPFLPVFTALLAITIFVVDTFWHFPDAVAVLYVVVVLLSVNFLHRRGLLLVWLACGAAASITYLVEHGFPQPGGPLVRLLVSLSAISLISLLAMNKLSAAAVQQKQGRLLDLAHDAIIVRDMNDVITYWNRGAELLYGWAPSAAIGRSATELLRTATHLPVREIRARVVAEGHWDGEIVRTRRDGRPMTVAARWSVQRNDRGQAVAILETNNDITDQRREEDLRLQAEAQLAHVSRVTMLGELTASIAHEVNQPLAAIVMNGDVCLRLVDRDPPDLAEVRDVLRNIIESGTLASQIIQRLRALFNKTEMQRARVDMNELIHDVLPLVQRQIANDHAALHLELACDLPPVDGDRVQLEQVIINLVVNAAQAMATVQDRPREVVVQSRVAEDGRVSIAVRDSGIGIDDAIAKHLFDPFFTTKPSGLGMGLAICRSIIEDHGGVLRASRNTGPGATFEFVLRPYQGATA